jgi:hypothetical protein
VVVKNWAKDDEGEWTESWSTKGLESWAEKKGTRGVQEWQESWYKKLAEGGEASEL